MRPYVSDHVLLEKPLYLAAVYRIASQAVNLPTDDTLRLAPLYTVKHIVEHGAAGLLRGLLLDELLRDMEIVALRYLTQFGELAINGQYLFVLDVGAFACVQKVIDHIFYDGASSNFLV